MSGLSSFSSLGSSLLTLDLKHAYQTLITIRPALIFLVGKAGTGKSTLSDKLIEHDFRHIDLDKIVVFMSKKFKMDEESLKTLYGDIYMGRSSPKVTQMFISLVREKIKSLRELNEHPIIVDGSMGHVELIKNVFKKPYDIFTLVFLYPDSRIRYLKRLTHVFLDDMRRNGNRIRAPSDVVDAYKSDGISSKIVRAFLKEQSILFTKKGQEALEKFKDFHHHTIKVLV